MAKRQPVPPPLELREFRSPEEIEAAIAKLRRRIDDLEKLDVNSAGDYHAVTSHVRNTIREVFGPNSPEPREHQYIRILAGEENMMMSEGAIFHGKELGRVYVTKILNGLIWRLEEKRMDFAAGAAAVQAPSAYFDTLNLHTRIHGVSRELFFDGHPWEVVFAAAKAMVNYVNDRSNRHDLDRASLTRGSERCL
jgi:hypothetical protein